MDAPALNKGWIDLRKRILTRSDDDGRIVLPKHEIGAILGQKAQGVLLEGKQGNRISFMR
jgi:hypothetical protein